MTAISRLLIAAMIFAVCSAVPASAQVCNDFDECTNPDMCTDGICTGTPISGGTCDDGFECTTNDTCVSGTCMGTPISGGECDDNNPCTVNDTCVSGQCQGTPVENNTPCGAAGSTECGLCTAGVCTPNPAKQNMACTDLLGNCTTNDVCIGIVCIGTPITCPDSDSNKCTVEFCNPAMAGGTCVTIGAVPCGNCSACDPETGACMPADQGEPCDDLNVCNGTGTCNNGTCVMGVPVGTGTATVTPTSTPILPTATVTPTGLPTGSATATVTFTPIVIGTATDTPTGTPTGTVSATATATGTPVGTATATVTATGTPTGTVSATVTATATNTTVPTATATETPAGPTFTSTSTRTGTVTPTPLPIVATIVVGSANGQPGSTVTFSVTLETTAQVAGTQNDIAFSPQARIAAEEDGSPKCSVNAAIMKDQTTFAFTPSDCTGTACTGMRAVVISFENLDVIPTGSVLYSCDVEIAADATGTLPLTCSDPGAGDPDAMKLGAACTDGSIVVAAEATPTGTTTATSTVTPPTGATATATASATRTVTMPSGGTPTSTGTGRATATVTATPTGGTPAATSTVTFTPPTVRTSTPTLPRASVNDDGCAVTGPAQSNGAWILLAPVAVLLRLRRRRR